VSASRPPRRSGYGLLLLAAGRTEGFAQFGADTDAFLASLAPLVAFTLVSAGIVALSGKLLVGTELFLLSLIGILAPPIIADPLCRRWQRSAEWPLYANILNWSKLLYLMVFPLGIAIAAAIPPAGFFIALGLLGYAFWFQWFIARGALRLSRSRALLMLLATQIGTNLLVILPLMLDSADRAEILKK
jgi:hypothetical protein